MSKNLLIATCNIRSFGSLTGEWLPIGSYSPKRDLKVLRAIADILHPSVSHPEKPSRVKESWSQIS